MHRISDVCSQQFLESHAHLVGRIAHIAAICKALLVENMQHGIVVVVGVDAKRCYASLPSQLFHMLHE